MNTVRTILRAGQWDHAREVDQIVADHDGRHRRRLLMRTESGAELMLDLAHTMHLREGDGLELQDDAASRGLDGGVVRVVAASEALLAITAADPQALMRLAWHLGNRHLAACIEPDRILVRADHVIADMIRGLGGQVRPVMAPFDPETGAYAGHRDASPSHEQEHAHQHDDTDVHGHHDHH